MDLRGKSDSSSEDTDAFRAAREYWIGRLPALPPSPELPLTASPDGIAQPKLKGRQTKLDTKTWQNLKDRAGQADLEPAIVLVAAFTEVLAIWTKSPHFTLYLRQFDPRSILEQDQHVEDDVTFLNLLEVNNSKPEGFGTRARRQREQLRQDFEYRAFDGVRVMRELVQSAGSAAIMPVSFSGWLSQGDAVNVDASCNSGRKFYQASPAPTYLDVTVQEADGELEIFWDAGEEVFPPGLQQDMFAAYQTLLIQLATDETSWNWTLADSVLKLLPAKQIRLFEEVNRTQSPASEEFLHTLFLKQVERQPDHLAVCTPSRRMSYAEVYSRACRIEEELLPRGLEPNQFAGIIMEKGWEQVVAAMGILFAGGAFMPIDPDLPPERQRYLIENGDVRVVLTQSSVQSRVSAPHDVEILVVDQMEPLEGRPATAPRTRQKREDLAYNIYTSGSTGQPKGVIVDHCAAVNTILDINERFSVGPADRVLALSRLSFDLSVYDIFGILAAGGTVVMPAPDRSQDTKHWAELIRAERVTIWDTVPALMGLLVDEAEHGAAIGQSLRLILMSGDWIPLGLPGQIRRLLPNAEIVSLGGATEAAIWSIIYPVENMDAKWKNIPYGKPMRNQTFHVLNEVGSPCPVWVPGQLYIGGMGLARGYWRDAAKTTASFIHHRGDGERLYRTGDWGRYLPDGNIEFLGREDFQVKLQGQRVELGEIEAKLSEHTGVDGCVVIVREDVPGDRRVVAYVIPRRAVVLQEAALREFLRAKLPEHMIPSAFVFLEDFPLTANGKVNRKVLPPAQKI